MTVPPARYWCPTLWPGGGGTLADALVEVEDGRIAHVTPNTPRPPDAVALPGLTMPGLANTHSHAFHRALRGRTHAGRGTFWTWREVMYTVAGALDPDSYRALARACYAEMALAGITVVGEFHYLHHAPGGARYADPNAMGTALLAAAADAGIRITLLDTLYLAGGLDVDGYRPLSGPQRRFGDGDVDRWWDRASARTGAPHAVLGAAAHSVRAVPPDALAGLATRTAGLPVHLHLSEQRAENDACAAHHGRTPTGLLADAGLLGERVTAVHATHLTPHDIAALGGSGTGVCLCPTTERDLADGTGPARPLADAGSPLSLGSDSHAVIDLLEEARATELDERLRTRERGHFPAVDLLTAATETGHRALGWPDAGRIAPGRRADLVTVDLDGVRLAGHDPAAADAAVVFAATAADVRHVVVDGRPVVADGRHLLIDDVPGALRRAIREVLA